MYWMIAARRTRFNYGLQRAAEWARHLGKPLLVLEALRCDYPWASDRLHGFVIQGMADNRAALDGRSVLYHPWLEVRRGEGKGLLEAMAADAAVVVTDDFPTFFLPRMVAAVGQRLPMRLEAVDGNGLVPMASADREHKTAHSFRRFLHKHLLGHIASVPLEDPLAEELPRPDQAPAALERWPAAADHLLAAPADAAAGLPIDHEVAPVASAGGQAAAGRRLQKFLDDTLESYAERRNRPDGDWSSGLSPYLHFGHISAHEIFLELMRRERWTPEDVISPADGRRQGWWGVRAGAEGFLDQVVTWRELGFHVCHRLPDHDRWESLPEWARQTLDEHSTDRREHVYTLGEFRDAATHDELWNAAQRQLLREGTIHNYLRMLWGKKILEWTESPRDALEVMVELNNRLALDGRDPNSYTGIFWVLGRHDRPWGPERPIFGKVRYMSSKNTARKLPVTEYLDRYAERSPSS